MLKDCIKNLTEQEKRMEDKLDIWVTMENYGIGEKLDQQK
jgi:hypothetical protein